MRELIAGIGLQAQPNLRLWQWSRVAGDLMGVSLLAVALSGKAKRLGRLALPSAL